MTDSPRLGFPGYPGTSQLAQLLGRLPECRRRELGPGRWLDLDRTVAGRHAVVATGGLVAYHGHAVLAVLGPGDGLSAAHRDRAAGLGALAALELLTLTPTTLLLLPAERYAARLRQDAELASAVAMTQLHSWTWHLAWVAALAQRELVRRVAGIAGILLARLGSGCPLVRGRFLSISQQRLADTCWLSRQALNRTLVALREARVLYLGRRFVCAPDLAALLEVADGRRPMRPASRRAHCKLRHPHGPLDCLPDPR